ncbi:MAG: DUF695 domain-containing protein [bacterium]
MRTDGSVLATKPWEDDFDFYFSETMKARVVITLDLGAVEVAPLQSHPFRLQARIEMHSPKRDGLRDLGEADALFELEDLLVDRLGGILPLLYVGRVVAVGDVMLIWYAPRAVERLMEELTEVVKEVRGDYVVRLSLVEDPKWSFYDDFMFPDVYNLQVMLNRRRLMTLQEHGDDGAAARELDHLAYFPSRELAEAAANQLEELGYSVEAPAVEAENPPDEELKWSLSFQRSDSLTEGRVDDVCIEILDVLLEHQGYYDGWGVRLLGPG